MKNLMDFKLNVEEEGFYDAASQASTYEEYLEVMNYNFKNGFDEESFVETWEEKKREFFEYKKSGVQMDVIEVDEINGGDCMLISLGNVEKIWFEFGEEGDLGVYIVSNETYSLDEMREREDCYIDGESYEYSEVIELSNEQMKEGVELKSNHKVYVVTNLQTGIGLIYRECE